MSSGSASPAPGAQQPAPTSTFNDSHRAFVQALLGRGVFTDGELVRIVSAIKGVRDGTFSPDTAPPPAQRAEVDEYLHQAGDALGAFDYEVRSSRHQSTGELWWAVVNTASDPPTQLATPHSPDEVAYVRRLLDAMFEATNSPRHELMCISEAQALKCARAPPPPEPNSEDEAKGIVRPPQQKGLKHSEALAVLAALQGQGWLERGRKGFYSLAPRALMELRSWLVATFNEPDAEEGDWQRIKFCAACKDIVTQGRRCAARDCLFRLHETCDAAFWRTQRSATTGGKICPTCKAEWTGENYVGEKAVPDRRQARTSTRADEAAARRRRLNSEDEEEDGIKAEDDMVDG